MRHFELEKNLEIPALAEKFMGDGVCGIDLAGDEKAYPPELHSKMFSCLLYTSSPVAIGEMKKMNTQTVFDKDKIALVMDHFIPNKDIKSAENCKCCRDFACRHEISNYFDVGEMGIEHALLPEKGLVVAGDAVIGADSHTCTYGALGAFSTGVGSTDMAAGMVTGKAWFKVPSAIQFELTGKPAKWVSGKAVSYTHLPRTVIMMCALFI